MFNYLKVLQKCLKDGFLEGTVIISMSYTSILHYLSPIVLYQKNQYSVNAIISPTEGLLVHIFSHFKLDNSPFYF